MISRLPPSLSLAGRHVLLLLALGLPPAHAGDGSPWFSAAGPTPLAREAVAVLGAADEDGLEPAAYDAAGLRAALDGSTDAAAQEALAARLESALGRFLRDLNAGRITPAEIDENYANTTAVVADADTLLARAIADGNLAGAVAAARPHVPEYAELRKALADYRRLATDPLWREALPPLPARKLEPGQPWAGLPILARRLAALGDLPAPTTPVAKTYNGALVDAVKAFQSRHGLTPDGVIGKGTWEALATPAAQRAEQLALALERLRWTPQPERAVIVNVPEFVLRAWDARDGQSTVRVRMNVIVGNAAKTQTPIFDADMRHIEFSPYWNVPPSIARGETLPKLRRDPAYFEQQGFEFVTRDGRVVGGFSEANLDAVQAGNMRIRQRPGAKNALGDIKFVFPNPDNIYLHHTPTPRLFQRDRRDFSHGCIRVEAPVDLAKFVLANAPEWNEERIVEAMTRGRSNTLRLADSLPVVIAYRTAAIIDGKPHFFPDLYRKDAALAAALARQGNPRTASAQGRNPS